MASPFHAYFSFHLNRHFRQCPASRATEATRAADSSVAELSRDLSRKYGPADFSPSAMAEKLEVDANFEAVFIYRCLRAIFRQNPQHALLPILSRLMKLRTGAEIYYSAEIGEGFRIVHSQGIVIGAHHRIGANFTCYQNVTIGTRDRGMSGAFAEIEEDCSFYAGSTVLAPLHVGRGVKLAAHAVLLSDAEPDSTYAGTPARQVR